MSLKSAPSVRVLACGLQQWIDGNSRNGLALDLLRSGSYPDALHTGDPNFYVTIQELYRVDGNDVKELIVENAEHRSQSLGEARLNIALFEQRTRALWDAMNEICGPSRLANPDGTTDGAAPEGHGVVDEDGEQPVLDPKYVAEQMKEVDDIVKAMQQFAETAFALPDDSEFTTALNALPFRPLGMEEHNLPVNVELMQFDDIPYFIGDNPQSGAVIEGYADALSTAWKAVYQRCIADSLLMITKDDIITYVQTCPEGTKKVLADESSPAREYLTSLCNTAAASSSTDTATTPKIQVHLCQIGTRHRAYNECPIEWLIPLLVKPPPPRDEDGVTSTVTEQDGSASVSTSAQDPNSETQRVVALPDAPPEVPANLQLFIDSLDHILVWRLDTCHAQRPGLQHDPRDMWCQKWMDALNHRQENTAELKVAMKDAKGKRGLRNRLRKQMRRHKAPEHLWRDIFELADAEIMLLCSFAMDEVPDPEPYDDGDDTVIDGEKHKDTIDVAAEMRRDKKGKGAATGRPRPKVPKTGRSSKRVDLDVDSDSDGVESDEVLM